MLTVKSTVYCVQKSEKGSPLDPAAPILSKLVMAATPKFLRYTIYDYVSKNRYK